MKESPPTDEPHAPRAPASRFAPRKLLKPLITLLILGAAGLMAWRYWQHEQLFCVTENAYVGAHVVQIAAQVSGPVSQLYVQDLQPVHTGDELFDIDPESFELALDEARALLQVARESVNQESASVQAAEAELVQRRAELQIAKSNERRILDLVNRKFLSEQAGETAQTQAESAAAAVDAAAANLLKTQSALGGRGPENATIQAAIARVEKATLDLKRTHVLAPGNGQIANLTLRAGSTVQAMEPLFTIIDADEFWVDANFLETEVERLHPGQHASITVDMYPQHPFDGEVQSISGGSGAAFSLLPPQNATGNWVKVRQRVPVRIRLTTLDARFPLRIGTSAQVSVRVQ
ncbi:MAG: HlyD family secretion protein [Gammaproteobacteria bacterium]|jgi:membrane fusion protein (multidrug efflux system)|nr:HlyD family secretion protein [Gammaproteobacteria bacterium]MBP6052279.1 HlyD family secretion protein [Pseudomonadales bacterium]MBK6581709.1 HlyD family secretion protein [Gammaproteobacteria bacterium]MBK7170102.1 HlyD family secretion protein [Gammaproteobacteria bacterium]MBK7520542.1 HlyD family secretion protein [Gammaproteobacteria bacterium]